jgi:hypothetical protein
LIRVDCNQAGQGWVCAVAVEQSGGRSEYRVSVAPADIDRWGSGGDQPQVEDLVRRSFEFLLEREPPTAILAEFELSVIRRYFPEYDRVFSAKR